MPPKRRASPEASTSTARKMRKTNGRHVPNGQVVDENGEAEMEIDDLDLSQDRDFDLVSPTNEAEVGIIEQVSLKNFMCHTRLDFKFCPQVNFVIGRNGSGKSAVLTSIVIGLGGKANATNRGSSVKGFIKTGKQAAEILVKLRNRGQDAYKSDLYGESIIVERRLNRDGTGQYKLKADNGKLVSTKREELTHILDAFNIQVDNPVSILNQDCSRNFLHSKNAQDKYKFFLKATQLEQLKNDYVVATEAKEIAQYTLQTKRETLPSLEHDVLQLEEQYKASKAVGGLKEKVKDLKCEQAWAVVSRDEKKLEKAAKELKVEDARKPKFIEKVRQKDEELTKLMNEKKELDERLKEKSKEATDLETQYKDAKKEMVESKKALRDTTMEQRKVVNELRGLSEDHITITDRIEEIRNSAQEDYEKERQVREEKIAELEAKIQEKRATQISREQEAEQYHAAVTKYKEDEYRLRGEEQDMRNQVEQLKRQVRDLEAARGNRIKRFGHWMPEVLAMIDDYNNRGLFHQKPRGPLGASLNLVDPKWALAIETCLKSLIHAFAVHDHHDERKLEEIFSKKCPEGRKPAIITSAFQQKRYNVSQHRAQTDRYPTVLDMLEIHDHIVANTLVDQRNIENVILIADKEEARKVMIHRVPQNVNEAFTLEGDHAYAKPTFRYYSNNKTKANILTASIEENIRYCQDQLKVKQSSHQGLVMSQRDVKTQIKNNQVEENKCQTQVMKLTQEMGQLNLTLSELKEKEDPAPVDITTLEDEAQRIFAQIQGVEAKKEHVDKQHADKQAEARQKEEAFKALDTRLCQLAESVDPYKEEQAKLDNNIGDVKAHKRHYEQKKKDHDIKIEGLKKAYDAQVLEFESDKQKAQEAFGDKCESRQQRTPENIQSEITQIQKQITKQEKTRGNHEELTRKYHEKQEVYKKILKEVNGLTKFLKKLTVSLGEREMRFTQLRSLLSTWVKQNFILLQNDPTYNKFMMNCTSKMEISHKAATLMLTRKLDDVMVHRQQQYFEFRKMIAVRAKYFFILMLNNRNYTGKISFNHQKELLTMSVTPNNTGGSEGSKDMKSLSGGERSFATVCFILSLWDAMESPFRCLDEFDVFMDLVNRRIATEMMLNVASQQKGRQFIFLTPLELSQMKIDNNCRVYRMPDPDRGQGTLPFRAVTEGNQEDED